MTNGPDVVFLGPSMRHEEARRILPNSILLAPAAMGDVLGAAQRFRPHSISIVDGTFLSNMSVFHKEILYAMDRGIWVLGSSSMGALRAAECDLYGMIGIGQIYGQLKSGVIEDDDEVALTHADESEGFRALSDALVTIRATLEGARDAGILTADETASLLAVQKERYFPDRRLSSVAQDAREIGLDIDRIDLLQGWVRHNSFDPKHADAVLLMNAVNMLPPGPVPIEDRPRTTMSGVFSATLARDVVVQTTDGHTTTHDRMRRYMALHDPDFEEIMRDARRMLVAIVLGSQLGGGPTAEELDEARRQIGLRLGLDFDQLEAYFRQVDLDERGVFSLLLSEAMQLRLENSFIGRSRMGMITEQFTHSLRLRKTYDTVKSAAALQQRAAETVDFEPRPSIEALIYTHALLSDWKYPEDWNSYIEHAELDSIFDLSTAFMTSVKAHHAFFGTGVMHPQGDVDILVTDQAPMMSRGR